MYDILKNHIEKIISLTDSEFEFVASLFTPKVYRKGQFIFHEGEYLTKNFFVCRGLVKLVYNDSDAREHIVSFAMEDWWETDFEAFYTQKKTTIGKWHCRKSRTTRRMQMLFTGIWKPMPLP